MWKNKNKNRCSLEIVGDVLSIASAKVKKTRIMYQANLSYVQLEKYLRVLLDGGLVQCDKDSCYLITQKGREFLKTYADYLERCSRIRKEAEETEKDRKSLESAFSMEKSGIE